MSESNAELYANPVPAAVRRSSKRAEDIARRAGATNVPADATVVEPAKEPVTPEPVVTKPVAPAPEVKPPGPVTEEDWKQKYMTLQGMHQAESQRAHSLERILSTIDQRLPAKPDSAPAPTVVAPVVPKEDIDTFGDDLVQGTQRWARAAMNPELEQLRARLADIEGQYKQVAKQTEVNTLNTKQQAVLVSLDGDLDIGKDWRRLNDSPEFVGWLGQQDFLSGQKRHDLLTAAFNSGNYQRTKAFFQAYLAEHTTARSPAPAADHTPTPVVEHARSAPTLEDFAAPGRSTGPAPSGATTGDKRIWTQRGIAEFYRDVQKGVFAGRDVERMRYEQDIFSAAAEGRIK